MVLEEGGDPKDGKALVEKLLSRSYHSAMGYRSGFTTNFGIKDFGMNLPKSKQCKDIKLFLFTGFSWTSMGMLKETTHWYLPSR